MNYATDIAARKEMIWCALSSYGSNIKDPIAYRNRKAKTFGREILTEAIGHAYEVIRSECLAVCIDYVDAKLSAKHGWETIASVRDREIKALERERATREF